LHVRGTGIDDTGEAAQGDRIMDAPSAATPLTGRCLCGTVRFRISGPLGPVVYCHCAECRRANGTAFATNANVRRSDIAFTAGLDTVTEYESSMGKFRAFCSRCGSPMFSRMTEDPDNLRIRLGTLEQDPGGRAVLHVWVADKAPWFAITDQVPQLAEGTPARPRGGN
jgi:hypothetical protein